MNTISKSIIDQLFAKYYSHLINTCRRQLRWIQADMSYAEDIFQEAALLLCGKDEAVINNIITEEQSGQKYFFYYMRRIITNLASDKAKVRRLSSLLDSDKAGESNEIDYSKLSEIDYNKLREMSCILREDSFVDPCELESYAPIKVGYVSGWVHAYTLKDRRYAYWQYSAFYGSRSKGEIPKRIKTAKSRHEAYMALCKFNSKLNEK